MDFKTFWFDLSQQQRVTFAGKVDRSPGYLQLVAGGFRKASPALAGEIQLQSEGRVTREEMRPDVYGPPTPSQQGREAA